MKKIRIAIVMPAGRIRDTFITPEGAARFAALGALSWNPSDQQYDDTQLARACADADVCVTGWGCRTFTEAVIKNAENLKIIAHTGGSVATLITKQLYDKGIKVISGNKVYAESVAEGVVAYILAALRRLPGYTGEMAEAGWSGGSDTIYNETLLDQTVGLVGFGTVSRYLVPLLKPFRCKLLAYDPYVPEQAFTEAGVERLDELEPLFTRSKIISLHMPINTSTFHMIDGKLLSLIPDGALFVNTARGACVDEAALAAELSKGRFSAILDVYEKEPLPMDSGLRGLENVILIPHMAGPTVDRRAVVSLRLADDIERYYKGQPMQNEIGYEYAVTMTNEASVAAML